MVCNICLDCKVIEKCKLCTYEVCVNCLKKLFDNNYKLCPICQEYDWFSFKKNIELIEDEMEEKYQQIIANEFCQTIRYMLIYFLSSCIFLFFYL